MKGRGSHLESLHSSGPEPSTRQKSSRTRSRPANGLARTLGAVGVALAATYWRVPVGVEAYIPALPVNDTSSLSSSNDLLHLYSNNGVFNTFISRQLWAEAFDSNGNYTNATVIVPWTRYSKGVLIHFNESLRDQPPAVVPWIAMINCDTNGTSFSENDDIFTITRDLGAQAALLYSLTSQGCQINAEYLNTFEKVLDVYATTSLQGSRIIESQFGGVLPGAYSYDSAVLNASESAIVTLLDNNALSVIGNVPTNVSLESNTTSSTDPVVTDVFGSGAVATSALPTPPSLFSDAAQMSRSLQRRQQITSSSRSSSATRTTASRTSSTSTPTPQNYLGAVMAAANLTVGGLQSASPTATPQANQPSSGGASTSLAMIILYAITGVVTLLFLVVIMSGAIRAARHPERYGPRAGGARDGHGGGGHGRTRAEGLTRAILDTFPIVRFGGRGRDELDSQGGGRDRDADVETGSGEGGSIGDGVDGRKKVTADADDNIELGVMPTVAAVGTVGNGAAAAALRRRSRASSVGESFQSASESLGPDGGHAHRDQGAGRPLAPPAPASTQPSSETGHASAVADGQQPPSSAAVDALIAETPMDADTESCPICLTEFEEGDELRILPCDVRHRFHSECIDPFLLNVSRLCPLCRLDLGHVSGAHGDEDAEEELGGGAGGPHGTTSERREEERVIRHLRALLHRSSNSSMGGTAGGGGGAAHDDHAADGTGAAAGANNNSRLRNRFAQYVVARRRERNERRAFRRGSNSNQSGAAYYGAPPF